MSCHGCVSPSLMFVALVAATCADRAAGQTAPPTDAAAQLARAEQLYDQANYRQAAVLLEPLVKDSPAGARGEIVAATRLLAQVYHRSADFTRAAAMAERHARMSPAADAEMMLVLADCYAALGRFDEARRQLVAFQEAFEETAFDDLNRARLASDAQRVAFVLRRATLPGAPNVAPGPADPPEPQPIAIATERLEAARRFEAANWLVDRHLEANRLDQAAALLASEIAAPTYEPQERAEFRLRLVDCYNRQALQQEAAGDDAAAKASIANARGVLNVLAAELNRRRLELLRSDGIAGSAESASDRKTDFARLVFQVARAHDLYGELLRRRPSPERDKLASEQLALAEKRYRQLLAAADASNSMQSFRDAALCGLQRVYDAQRLATTGDEQQDVLGKLCRISDMLVAERAARLLDTDPALYDARRARASVYAARDDHEGYAEAEKQYRELVAFWEASPHSDPQAQATALVGLAEVLRALDKTPAAHAAALQASRLLAGAPLAIDADSRRDHALLAARIENSLAVSSIALGQYRDALHYLVAADRRLKPYGERAAAERRRNQEALRILSRVKVYRGLLHKAEAQFDAAASSVREGRELREQLAAAADLLAYYLAEASVQLAQARALMQESPSTVGDATAALASAEAALNRAQPFTETRGDGAEPRQMAAVLPYRFLRGLLARLRGNREEARQAFTLLADECQRYGDGKTAAKCYMQLAQLVAEEAAKPSSNEPEPGSPEAPALLARADAEQLLQLKLARHATIQEAAGYAARAVTLFQEMEGLDRKSAAADEEAATALPSLHFQAAYLAARLHVVLAMLDRHVAQLNGLLAAGESDSAATDRSASLMDAAPDAADHAQLAIRFLEDAVTQAELPARSTTQVRLQRARFFSRYAPAYDLLVDLHAAAALEGADQLRVEATSGAFIHLRRAIEIADMARNRTFREQIDGWRESAGNAHRSQAFDWARDMARLAAPGTAVLVYHLDGPQLFDAGNGNSDQATGRIGGGHLFVVYDQGREIAYYRLAHHAPGTARATDLTRQSVADLVRRHIAWIERPEAATEWGRAEQRALTDALLPRELLQALVRSAKTTPVRQVLIVPDGALHQLPFESLLLPTEVVAGAAIRYALDELPPIRYGPSLSVLAVLADRAGPGRHVEAPRLLTVGNPAYPDRGRQRDIPAWGELFRSMPKYQAGFPELAHSAEECQSVYASFDELATERRTKLLGEEATESAVRNALAASRFIHLATHGCVDYQNDNLYGALLFAPGRILDGTRDDGILQLRDIYGIDLSGCELAVLSACQTYVGPERPLEAGTSMARAFLEQGARRVVCSQWSTDDQATTDLMKVFFESIRTARQAGQDIDYALALHEAKRAIRANPERGTLPRFWAPFVLVGAP